MTTRYEVGVLAPRGVTGRSSLDVYTTGPNYAIDHSDGPCPRLLLQFDDGKDDKGRPVISASYGGGMRSIVRPVD